MEIKQLIKHSLDFNITFNYIIDNLKDVNALSMQLLELLDLKKGRFFVLLPSDANLDEINNFNCGGILPQFPEEKQWINGRWSTYSWIPNIRSEISSLIMKEMNQRNNLSAVMDSVKGEKPKDESHPCFYDNYTVFYDKEVYSLVNTMNGSIEILLKCFKRSLSFWHSLGVLTTADLTMVDKELSLENIKDICLKTEVAFVGAYDGEGYVFWERNPPEGSRRYFEKNLKST